MNFYHFQTETVARIGAGVTGSSIFMSFMATALPVVQFIAAVVGVAVGIATFVYYVKRIRKE
jgi:membrane associated rhomboid family serine protease